MKGVESLQNMKLCHRNLTLDSIVVRPRKNNLSKGGMTADHKNSSLYCTIRNFENAVRVPCSTSSGTNDATTKVHMMTFAPIQPQLVRTKGNWNIQFVAPEVLNSSRNRHNKPEEDEEESGSPPHGPFDGYAMDLWAVGVMILSMLLGNDKIFVAPILEDRIFQQISVHEQLKEYCTKIIAIPQPPSTTDTLSPVTMISDNALDLVQQMLRFDPNERPTLHEIQQHPWFTVK
jgi:serine/threonine protein kinase